MRPRASWTLLPVSAAPPPARAHSTLPCRLSVVALSRCQSVNQDLAGHNSEAGARSSSQGPLAARSLARAALPRVTERPPVISLQFVLKHEALAHLREVAFFPNTLNPHEAESLALVGAMVDQVMELHPGSRWLHVGCDEVGACIASSAPQFCSSLLVFTSRPPSPTSRLLLNRNIVHVPKDKGGLAEAWSPVRALGLLTLTWPRQTWGPSRHSPWHRWSGAGGAAAQDGCAAHSPAAESRLMPSGLAQGASLCQ